METITQPKLSVIYLYDALCGWCYGFSKAMHAFAVAHQNEFSVDPIAGGMITGEREGPLRDVAPYIKGAYREVEERTGVRFGNDFLEKTLEQGDVHFSSVPPALALEAFKALSADQHLDFASKIQTYIYYHGYGPTDPEMYRALATEFGVDPDDFIAGMRDEDVKKKVEEGFRLTEQLKVQGFPTVILKNDSNLIALAQGATSQQALEQNYKRALETYVY